MNLEEEVEEAQARLQRKVASLQQAQEELRMLVARRMQWEAELKEIEGALSELGKLYGDTVIYKIVGPLMFATNRERSIEELRDRKETIEVHVRTLERQESLTRKRIEGLRKQIAKDLEGQMLK